MARLWNEDIARLKQEDLEEMRTWEVLHEEGGFEDIPPIIDEELSDLDGAETHMHFHTDWPGKAWLH